MTARIDLAREDGRHHPGDVLTGTVDWSLPAVPLNVAVRLCWRTEGKSWPADRGVLGVARFEDLRAIDQRAFAFTLPVMPYSFSGKMLSVVWRLELLVRSRRLRGEKVEGIRIITRSPTGDAIDLYGQ